MPDEEPLIPPHGGFRKLKSFQVAQLVYDLTVRFCDRYVSIRSRTHDQMIQAARSGVQNIAEGSQASGTAKKMELKLTNVARASLEELLLDYEDFLRHRNLSQWDCYDDRIGKLISLRPKTPEDVVKWAKVIHDASGRDGLDGQNGRTRGNSVQQDGCFKPKTESISSIKSILPTYPEIAANGALALIRVACSLLDRQLTAQAKAFETEGGFTERIYRKRKDSRRRQ